MRTKGKASFFQKDVPAPFFAAYKTYDAYMNKNVPVMTARTRILLATPAVYILWTMGWAGIMTFVNGYFAEELRQGVGAWSNIMLWYSGGVLIWQVFITEISSRVGRLTTLTTCCTLGSVLYAGIPAVKLLDLFQDPEYFHWYMRIMFIIISSIPAVAIGVWMPMVATVGGTEPGKLMAWVQGINVVAGVGVFQATSWLITTYRYDLSFYAIGGMCLAATVFFTIMLAPIQEIKTAPLTSLFRIDRSHLRILMRPAVLLIMLCGFFAEPFSYQTNYQLWPNLIQDVHHWATDETNLAITFARLPGMLPLFLLGFWIDRTNPVRIYAIMILLTGLATFLGGASTSNMQALGAYIAFHTFQAGCWGCNLAALNAQVPPAMRDAAICMGGALMTGSALLVGLLHAWMTNRGYSLPIIFQLTGIVAVVLGSMLLLTMRSQPAK